MTRSRLHLAILAMHVAVLAPLAAPPLARGGTYDVPACDAAGGVNNSWFAYSNSPHTPAYAACPSSGDANRGLVARNAVAGAGARVPAGTTGMMIFAAPAGTSIIGIRAAYRFSKTDGAWQAALSTGSQVIAGCTAGPFGCVTSTNDVYLPVPGSSRLYIEAFCAYSSCAIDSTGDPSHAYLQATANLYSAVVRIQDDVAPSIGGQRGSLLSPGWHSGSQTVAFDASDNTGIAETKVLIDGKVAARLGHACDYTASTPCGQGGDSYDINTSSVKPDGAHTLSLQAVDAAGGVAQTDHRVLVDNSPSAPPRELTVDGGEGWRSTNAFSLSWRNESDTGAPVAGAEYELCTAAGQDCRRGQVTGANLTSLKDLKVPGAGDYLLRLWLRDEAANQDRRNAAPPVHLRFDDEQPSAVFAPTDPASPARIVVAVTDRISGLGDGAIEIKSERGKAWRPLASRVEDGRVVADIDDEHLRDGIYHLRALVSDRAGNQRVTDQRTDGSHARVTLPLRLKTRLRVGAARRTRSRGRARTALRRKVKVGYGRRVRLHGRLTTADGTAFPGTEILVMRRFDRPGATPTPVATLRTSRTGRFSYLAPKGVSREILFRYAGTDTVRAITRSVHIRVPARTTFHPLRGYFVNGQLIRFRGRLHGGHIPARGKLVQIQVKQQDGWHTFLTARTNRRGRWQRHYHFTGTNGRKIYNFRALVEPEAGYPYATGKSRRSEITVQGL